jgi:hypothetical protein
MKFSQSYTPYRGAYPRGWGGIRGRYPSGPDNVVLNIQPVLSKVADSTSYVKPSVLSNRGMLARRFRWINSGQYPSYWVQPDYTGNQSDSASQGVYTHTKSAQSDCVVDTNDVAKYVGNIKFGGSSGCETTPARGYTFNIQQSNAPYTKFLHVPQTSSQHTLRIQRKCVRPLNYQKPYPGPTNGDTCNQTYTVDEPIFVDKELFEMIDHNQNPEILLKQTCN